MSPNPGDEAHTVFSETVSDARKTLWRSLSDKIWALSTFLYQRKIYWQDRFGRFNYQDWIRTVEARKIQTALRQQGEQPATLPPVCFGLASGIENRVEVLQTLNSLQQYAPGCPVVFFLPKTSPDLESSWLQNLLRQHPQYSVITFERNGFPEPWIQYASRLPADWVIPLHAGDTIALFWGRLFNRFLADHPQAKLIYWDEDYLDEQDRRLQPFFKPNWSPELLFSINYLETAAFHRSLLVAYRKSKPFGSAGWIFELSRMAEQVVHIPFILQHRKARSEAEKQQAAEQHAESARAFLQGQGFETVQVRLENGHSRLQWKSQQPPVSIIIPTKNNLLYLRRCITSLLEKTAYPAYEILLMDDHSTDPDVLAYYQEIQAACPYLHVHENDQAFNWSRVNNQGARLASGSLLLFLNNDVEILDVGWLDELVRWTLMPGVGIVGAKLVYPDQAIQHAGIVVGMTGHANHLFAGQPPAYGGWFVSPDDYRNVSAVTGACLMARRDMFEQIGGFNEDFLLVFNDVEFGVRALHSGYRVVYTPAARLIHYEGRSRGRHIPAEDIRLGADLLGRDIHAGDRFYNPNLSLAVNWPTLTRRDEPDASRRLARIVSYKS